MFCHISTFSNKALLQTVKEKETAGDSRYKKTVIFKMSKATKRPGGKLTYLGSVKALRGTRKVQMCPVRWCYSKMLEDAFLENNPHSKAILFFLLLINHRPLRWSFSRIILMMRKGYRLHIINVRNQNFYKYIIFNKEDCIWIFILLVIYSYSFLFSPSAVTCIHM